MAGLPPLYARWVADIVDGAIPDEVHATCDTCAMCGADTADSELVFDARTKCCTHIPVLPNFLVGAIAADPAPEMADGRRSILARIARRAGVTPLGLTSTRTQVLIYERLGDAFGRAATLRCPHYLERGGGQCGIWQHRNAVCSTWFCKHVRGKTGLTLWQAIESLLSSAERSLAIWCALELGVEPQLLRQALPRRNASPLASLDAADIDDREPSSYPALWGRWDGHEVDLYIACSDLTSDLAWSEVERIGGPELVMYRKLLQTCHAALATPRTPRHVRTAAYRVIHAGKEIVRLQTYSPYDPIELPTALMSALTTFNGIPVEDALQRLATEHGLDVEPGLVRQLVDFGLLVDLD